MNTRDGSEVDADDIADVWKQLGFEVDLREDNSASEMLYLD